MKKLRTLVLFLLLASGLSANAQDRAQWMKKAGFGVMTHYLADWMARAHSLNMNVEQWNKLIDNFDVEESRSSCNPWEPVITRSASDRTPVTIFLTTPLTTGSWNTTQ
jgi:hypothetical protein